MFWSILHCGQAAAFLGDGHTSLVRDDENYNIEHVIQTTNNSKELHPRRNVSVSSYRAAAVTKPEANATVQSFNDQRAPSSGDGDRTHNGSIANRIALHQTAGSDSVGYLVPAWEETVVRSMFVVSSKE